MRFERLLGRQERGELTQPSPRWRPEQLLQRHGYVLGYTVTKLALQAAGLVRPAPKRSAHRKKRPRRPMRGCCCTTTGRGTPGWKGRQRSI